MNKGYQYSILVVGDAHVEQEDNLRRFTALANYMKETLPDAIVFMGDFLSLDSMSAWDKDKRKLMEGRRFSEEITQGNRALDIIDEARKKISKYKKKKNGRTYKGVDGYFLEGNHEYRLKKYLEYHPELDSSTMNIESLLGLNSRGYKYTEYGEYLYLIDTQFTHIPIQGNGRPLSGPNVVNRALDLHHFDVVFGHTHKMGLAYGSKLGTYAAGYYSYNCGCFFEGIPHYILNKSSASSWWRGVTTITYSDDTLLIDCKKGFDLVPMETLLAEYL